MRPAPAVIYVPASRPSMLAKLPDLDADAVILDLEDGVAPGDKQGAREQLLRAAREDLLAAGAPCWLRVNPIGTPWHEADLDLARRLPLRGIVLPKAECVEEVRRSFRQLDLAGAENGLMIETARGVGRVRDLAQAEDSVALLIYGSADYRLDLGARPDAGREWERLALQEILLAARMADCLAIDGVHFEFRDLAGLECEAALTAGLGFDGKSCIHPGQIETIRRVFSPGAEQLAWARRVLEAWREQDGDSRGVIVAEGEMLEALHVRLARRILGS